MTDEDIFQRACRAYYRHYGANAEIPSQQCSGWAGKMYELRNLQGVLAQYLFKRDRFYLVERDDK